MPTALESLDAFLARAPEDRTLTRRVRRHLHQFRSLAIVGPREASRALVLRLAETFPARNVHLLAHDGEGRRFGKLVTSELAWQPVEVDASNALRSFLRQDPDAIAATALRPLDLPLVVNASCTGHVVIFGAPATSVAELEAVLRSPELADLPPVWPTALVLDSQGKLSELLDFDGSRWAPVPDAPPEEKPVNAPLSLPTPGEARSPNARVSWVPRTRAGALTPHRIASRSALLPPTGWPHCADCGKPKQHVVQLTGAELPEPLRRTNHVVQLFVCPNGCDLTNDAGPTLAAYAPETLVETPHPLPGDAGFGGGVVEWLERREEPHPDDESPPDRGDEPRDWPWNCDKLGGWPHWEQGAEWPEHGGAKMELLFQVAEAGAYMPGTPPRWDDARAEELPGTPRVPRLDPERPVHLAGLFSGGDGCGWIFRSTVDPTILQFVWQTS